MYCVADEGSTVSTADALASFAMGTLRVEDTVSLPDELLIHVRRLKFPSFHQVD